MILDRIRLLISRIKAPKRVRSNSIAIRRSTRRSGRKEASHREGAERRIGSTRCKRDAYLRRRTHDKRVG